MLLAVGETQKVILLNWSRISVSIWKRFLSVKVIFELVNKYLFFLFRIYFKALKCRICFYLETLNIFKKMKTILYKYRK